MFKLIEFLSASRGKGKKDVTPVELEQEVQALELTLSEREEIRCTVRKLTRESSMILTTQLAQLNLHRLVEEIELPPVVVEPEEEVEESEGCFDTFRPAKRAATSPPVLVEEEEDDSENDYGTFRPSRAPALAPHSLTGTIPQFAKREEGAAPPPNSLPDFSKMMREPENWEKHILALEKGEWTNGMEQNGAFKRWKKERPPVPSIYMRSGSST
jgi:hypothetical protein